MKKIVVAIFAFLYLGVSTGATVHLHYCMGELVNWGLWQDTSKKCGKCGMEKDKKNGCCKDEHKQFKIENDQKTAKPPFQIIQLLSVAAPPSFIEISVNNLPSVTEENSLNHAPSRSSGIAVYIRNRFFRI